ncbi:hypothetical protein GDO81_004812 [Engystomops pustulosus]|uniref:Uncharacterized protein n=1 Tax=Engystomops pustulosus TaxID=76066 RepID=A0AAV7CIM8_ENGPU|nr:hypothetical protein GDO81_004812 [Engystomops pustulosus]
MLHWLTLKGGHVMHKLMTRFLDDRSKTGLICNGKIMSQCNSVRNHISFIWSVQCCKSPGSVEGNLEGESEDGSLVTEVER